MKPDSINLFQNFKYSSHRGKQLIRPWQLKLVNNPYFFNSGRTNKVLEASAAAQRQVSKMGLL